MIATHVERGDATLSEGAVQSEQRAAKGADPLCASRRDFLAKAPAIDVCGTFFDRAMWEHLLFSFAEQAPQYLWKFHRRYVDLAGVDAESYRQALHRSPQDAVRLLLAGEGLDGDIAELAASLQHQGIVRQVLHGIWTPEDGGFPLNLSLIEQARPFGGLFEVWAGLSLRQPEEGALLLEKLVLEQGLRGCGITPFLEGISPDAATCGIIFETAERLGLPIWIHSGQSFASHVPMDLCGWQVIDRLAGRHPELKILIGHGGWPWISEMMALCQRHRHVYLEFSSYRPRNMLGRGSGWEPLFEAGAAGARGRVLFGSSSWVHNVTERELIEELGQSDLEQGVLNDWIFANAARLLGVDAPSR